MPFDFVAYEASCRLLHPEQLQLEWENYTRQIAGGATSTGASVAFAPVTGGVSLLGLGLSAPKIHNARKKREIIERCLATHGQVPSTRKRDVMGPAAVAGGISVLTLGLAAPGAEALGGEIAVKGAEYVVAHVALDGAGAAGEHVHGEHHKKKKEDELKRRKPLPGYVPAQPGQPGAVPIPHPHPPQGYQPQQMDQQTYIYASQTEAPTYPPQFTGVPQGIGYHQQPYGFQAPGPALQHQMYQQPQHTYQQPAVTYEKSDNYGGTQAVHNSEQLQFQHQQNVAAYAPASHSQHYLPGAHQPHTPFQEPIYGTQPTLNLQTKPVINNGYVTQPPAVPLVGDYKYQMENQARTAQTTQQPFVQNVVHQPSTGQGDCEPPRYSFTEPASNDKLQWNGHQEQDVVGKVGNSTQSEPLSPNQLADGIGRISISNLAPENPSNQLKESRVSTPAPPYNSSGLPDPSLVPMALFNGASRPSESVVMDQPVHGSEKHSAENMNSSRIPTQRPETLIHQDSGYQSRPPTPVAKIGEYNNRIETPPASEGPGLPFSSTATAEPRPDTSIHVATPEKYHSQNPSLPGYSQPMHPQYQPQLPESKQDFNTQVSPMEQTQHLTVQTQGYIQQFQQNSGQEQLLQQPYTASPTTQQMQQQTGFYQPHETAYNKLPWKTQQPHPVQPNYPYQPPQTQSQHHEYQPPQQMSQAPSQQDQHKVSISQPQIYIPPSTGQTQTYYPPPSPSCQSPQYSIPPSQTPNQNQHCYPPNPQPQHVQPYPYQYQIPQQAQAPQYIAAPQPQMPYFAPPPVAMSHPGSQPPLNSNNRRKSVLISGINSISSNLSSRFGK